MELASLLRPLGLIAGPAAGIAVLLMVAAVVTAGDAVESSPLATASSAVLLVALLGIAAAGLATLARLHEAGRGVAGPALAVVGTALVFGAGWTSLFLLPGLAADAPDLLEAGLPGVRVGFIASYLVFLLGWVWTGISLVRSRLVPAWLGAGVVVIAGVLTYLPAPQAFRLILISVAATLLARRLAAATPARVAVPA